MAGATGLDKLPSKGTSLSEADEMWRGSRTQSWPLDRGENVPLRKLLKDELRG